jgi:hypothetical protein
VRTYLYSVGWALAALMNTVCFMHTYSIWFALSAIGTAAYSLRLSYKVFMEVK